MAQPIKNHFRNWVPHWLKITVMFMILLPVLMANGAYVGSNVDISGSLGVLSEDINMAYYAASAGMCIAYLLVPIIKPVATAKTIILSVLLFQVLLSLVCAKTNLVEVIIICSFFIGIFKGFSMFEVIVMLMPELSRSGTRNEFYAKFYPITITVGQLSLVLTAEMAYQYQWQYMYYFMILLLLVAMLSVVVCMAYARRLIRIPFKDIDWLALLMVSVCIMSVIYVCTYGKTNDWFSSPEILIGTILALITGYIFIYRQLNPSEGKNPLLNMSVLKNRNSVVAYLMSFILMFFVSFSLLASTYVTSILRLGSDRANELYLYMIPGIIAGGVLCYYFYLKAIRMAWIIFFGFACFTLSIAILYFKVDVYGLYEDIYIPMFLRGMGMLSLFVALGVYCVQGLQQKQMMTNAFFLIAARSTLAPAIGSSILSNWIYRLQQQNITILMQNVDMQNDLAVSRFGSSARNVLAQGWSAEDAQRIATNSIYSTVQTQAALVSIKTILGWMLILGIIVLIGILLYFFQFKPVKLMKVGSDMKG